MADAVRRVAVLGSTGSIGRSTLDVISAHPQRLQLVGVAARSRVDILAQQVERHRPRLVALWDEERVPEWTRLTGDRSIMTGTQGLLHLATHPDVDVVVVATSGSEALLPLIRAIQAGKRIALASKELLVMAGGLIMRLVEEHGTSLVPIDSEHAALFQCLQGVPREDVARLVVTGSGGSLWGKSAAEISAARREQVLAHPKWQMGEKITVDSATLMNKGLEVIEAHWLFGVELARLQVVIHPEAVIHALVEMVDGTLLAQLSACDMRLPIQYALGFPQRWASPALPRLNLTQLPPLRFVEPDTALFPCLDLAWKAAQAGGTACTVLNAANEVAVRAYLGEQIAFGDIPRVIADTLETHRPIAHPTLDDVLTADAWARSAAQERLVQCLPR